ncbi:MAG: hypothetical protein AAF960_07035 [Bacteroidota bacterium]
MRIVGDIPHPQLKITIFLHDSKYSVKFESGLYEQTYKFRSGGAVDSVDAIKAIVDDTFIQYVLNTLPTMHQQKMQAVSRWMESQASFEFEEII